MTSRIVAPEEGRRYFDEQARQRLGMSGAADVGFEPLRRIHIPGRHMVIADVVRFAIEEFGVQPLRTDWERLLTTE